MGNCIKGIKFNNLLKNKTPTDKFSEDNMLNEESPLMPNFNRLNKIFNKEICAICETKYGALTKIDDRKQPGLQNMVYCKKCKQIMGY